MIGCRETFHFTEPVTVLDHLEPREVHHRPLSPAPALVVRTGILYRVAVSVVLLESDGVLAYVEVVSQVDSVSGAFRAFKFSHDETPAFHE